MDCEAGVTQPLSREKLVGYSETYTFSTSAMYMV